MNRIFSSPVGPKPLADNAERLGSAEVLERLNANHGEVKDLIKKTDDRIAEVKKKVTEADARLIDIEQKAATRSHLRGAPTNQTWGQMFVANDQFRLSRAVQNSAAASAWK
jgi:hypothetical protein